MRAIEYSRYSSNNQREESIDAQRRAIKEYADKNNITIVGSYQDEAVSGKTMERDNFIVMMNAIMKKEIVVDMILVHKFSRFARNKYDSAINKKKLKNIGVSVVSVTQSIDDTPEGAMLETIIEAMDEYYSANLALEVQKGLKENALKAQHTGGRVPFGFSLDENKKYIPNEDAKAVKYMFEKMAEGMTMKKICENLNNMGYLNPQGKPLNDRALYVMLHNEKYIGNYVYNLTGTQQIRHDNIIPPIIDIDLWNAVQKRLKSQKPRNRADNSEVYYLSGKAVCGLCGLHITGGGYRNKRQDGTKIYYYRCSGIHYCGKACTKSTLKKTDFENVVFQKVINTIMNENAVRDIARLAYTRMNEIAETPTVTTEKLRTELNNTLAEQKRLVQLYTKGRIDEKILDEESDILNYRKIEIENELKKRESYGANEDVTEDYLYEVLQTFINHHINEKTDNTSEFAKHIFNTFVEKVVVVPTDITVIIKPLFLFDNVGSKMNIGGAKYILSPIEYPVKIVRHHRRKLTI